MPRARWGLSFALLIGCSSARFGANETGTPSLIFPAHFAEGHTGKEESDGGRAAPDAGSRRHGGAGFAPDPAPLASAHQWQFDLEYDKGKVHVLAARRLELGRSVLTPRKMGRFALELWVGKEMIERVRFDFPLLAADQAPTGERHPLKESPRFAPGADTRQRVLVPDSDRATSAKLVDRLTGATLAIPWPPGSGDAGAPTL